MLDEEIISRLGELCMMIEELEHVIIEKQIQKKSCCETVKNKIFTVIKEWKISKPLM